MKHRPRLLIIVSSFPKPPNLMNLSPWALDQTQQLAKIVDCTVVSPTPNLWIPHFATSFLPSKFGRWSGIEIDHDFGEFRAHYVRVPLRTYTRNARFKSSGMVAESWTQAVEDSIDMRDFDIVLAHHPMVEGLVAKRLKDKYGIPFITIEHSRDDPFTGNNEFSESYSRVADSADAFIVPSKQVLDKVSARYFIRNALMIHNGGAKLSTQDRTFDLSDKVEFVSIGALVECKNHETLIRAFDDKLLRQRGKLRIVGVGPLKKQYEHLVSNMQLGNVVEFVGQVPHDLVFQMLDQSHVFVLLSEENFSVAAVEAMGKGLPVVLSESTGVAEVVTDGVQGFVVQNEKRKDPKYISSILRQFVIEPSLIPRMSRASLELSKSLTWEGNAQAIAHLVGRILNV